MKTTPEIATIATLPDGSTIERETSPRLVKWWHSQDGRRTLLQKEPRWELAGGNVEKFILHRFAEGAQIHTV
jgi:hypothetical protein